MQISFKSSFLTNFLGSTLLAACLTIPAHAMDTLESGEGSHTQGEHVAISKREIDVDECQQVEEFWRKRKERVDVLKRIMVELWRGVNGEEEVKKFLQLSKEEDSWGDYYFLGKHFVDICYHSVNDSLLDVRKLGRLILLPIVHQNEDPFFRKNSVLQLLYYSPPEEAAELLTLPFVQKIYKEYHKEGGVGPDKRE